MIRIQIIFIITLFTVSCSKNSGAIVEQSIVEQKPYLEEKKESDSIWINSRMNHDFVDFRLNTAILDTLEILQGTSLIQYYIGDSLVFCNVRDGGRRESDYFFPVSLPLKLRYQIYKLKGKVIPTLINMIDFEDMATVFSDFADPWSSTMNNMIVEQVGIQYAYMIEFILKARDMDRHIAFHRDSPEQWQRLVNRFKVFEHCIIVKRGASFVNSIYDHQPLAYKDLCKIRTIYSKWWEKNKDKPFEDLKRDYQSVTILEGSEYEWI